MEVPARQIPDGLEARAALFRDRVAGKDALIILDDAADEQQVLPLMPASPTCLVLVTSRCSLIGLDAAAVTQLDVFDPGEAVALLARIAGGGGAGGGRGGGGGLRVPAAGGRPGRRSPACAALVEHGLPAEPAARVRRGIGSASVGSRCRTSSTCPTRAWTPGPGGCSGCWRWFRARTSHQRRSLRRAGSTRRRPSCCWRSCRTSTWSSSGPRAATPCTTCCAPTPPDTPRGTGPRSARPPSAS
ncbi:hypothetical protein ACQ4WX_00740 [Streptomyces lasalocidi]